jgi:mannonate dehydratase
LLAGGDMRTWARDIEVTLKPYALTVGANRDQKSERSPGKRKTTSKRRNISQPVWKTLSRVTLRRTAREAGRGGSRNAAFRWSRADQTTPPTAAGILSAEENWERIDHFLGAVVPVATAAKVRLACHPHDPYTPPGYRGVTRVLGTVDGLKRFVEMHESPYHGLNFCQGTIAEMLDEPAREIFDVISWLVSAARFSMSISATSRAGNWTSWRRSRTRVTSTWPVRSPPIAMSATPTC